jgi:DNA polymerase III subunit delta
VDHAEIKRNVEAGRIAPVYFFWGEETYPIDSLVSAVIRKAVEPESRDFNLDVWHAEETDIDAVLAAINSYPMMAERRVAVLKSVQKLSASEKDRIAAYVRSPVESTVLVLVAGKADRRQSFYAELTKTAVCFESKPLYENQAVKWVMSRLASVKMSVSEEAATLLVRQTGVSLWALDHEIEKLATRMWGKNRIGPEDVAELSGVSRKHTTWEWTDTVGRREIGPALSMLDRLIEEGQSPVGLIAGLSERVFLLLRLRHALDRGVSEKDASRESGLSPFFSRLYLAQAGRYKTRELLTAVRSLREADARIKTGRMEPRLAVTLAVHGLIRSKPWNF